MALNQLLAIPAPPQPTTFVEFYGDPNNDPYEGDYEAVMREFRNVDNPPSASAVFSLIKTTGQDTPNCYIGLYEEPDAECGWSLALSGIHPYSNPIGRRDQ